MLHKIHKINRYYFIISLLVLAFGINSISPYLIDKIEHLPSPESFIGLSFWCTSLILGFGWLAAKFTHGTIIPSFVLQIIVSIFLHDALSPLASQPTLIAIVCTALAALILKGGGDEIDQKEFIKIAVPTITLAVVGYLVTFFVSLFIFNLIGLDLTLATVLSAIIGSTDPAALIPTLKNVVFKKENQKLVDISIAESAINDAVGAVFTGAVLLIIATNNKVESISFLTKEIFAQENLMHLGGQILFGCIAGFVGFLVMFLYQKLKSLNSEKSVDFAVILVSPIISFLIAILLHGNGFLAAFLTGLLANYNHNAKIFDKTLHAMEVNLESIAKPVIFMMVGPLVSFGDLADNAKMGIILSLVFILIIRPVAVFVSTIFTNLTTKQKLFLCSVRETGVIPIVLAVITVKQLPQLAPVLPLTAWTVLITLVLLPALTPMWSDYLGLTDKKE